MNNKEPIYLSQGVSYLGFLAQQLGDLRGNVTLAHELIQNADDAKDENGNLAATKIAFDVTDDALLVHNDAVFRDSDFERMRTIASGSKRNEEGDRTTGAFGIGFISVYQITDRPEIHSSGLRWILRPDATEDRRIEQWLEPSVTPDKGTQFRLPWAFEKSAIRRELKASPVDAAYIKSFIGELKEALPRAILFLKRLESIELRHNGKIVSCVERTSDNNLIVVSNRDKDSLVWELLTADFSIEALSLFKRFPNLINGNRSTCVRVALPASPLSEGRLYATLPTEQLTGLPFHIDADFYPTTDRKSIAFEDSSDYRSEWNRAALKAAGAVVGSNLLSLRDSLGNDAVTFWRFLEQIQQVHQEHRGNSKMPLGVFWDNLLPTLGKYRIVFVKSGKWLNPRDVRIPTGREQEAAISAFNALGLETVHHDLWRYRNILTRNDIGVKSVTMSDIRAALDAKGLYGQPRQVLEDFQSMEELQLLWRGIHAVLETVQANAKSSEGEALSEYTLAPGIDGRFYSCGSAFRSDAHTRKLFAPLLPDSLSFLSMEDVPLLQRICPTFTPLVAIQVLESIGQERLLTKWNQGDFDPASVLRWFDENKAELTRGLRERLTNLAIFPSVTSLHSLSDLWMPGGFADPLGNTNLLDMRHLTGLSDFLRSLGVTELTFSDYATQYVPEAFADNSTVGLKSKLALLDMLERRIGELKDLPGMQDRLANSKIIECSDDVFRKPYDAYFQDKGTLDVFGEYANYVKTAHLSKARRDLFEWLGVTNKPRIKDVLNIINIQTDEPPNSKSRSDVIKMLETLGGAWNSYGKADKRQCGYLKGRPWLPAENDTEHWYAPTQLYATHFKHLFASQATFIDIPRSSQQTHSAFLSDIGVKSNPEPYLVIRHLIGCANQNIKRPNGIYQWLDSNARPQQLQMLIGKKCLWVNDKYYSPDQVYWESHTFGRFRVQLGQDIRGFQKLLDALGVRDAPNHKDAIDVLKEVSHETGNGYLQSGDESVVLMCWEMLSDALREDAMDSESLEAVLNNVPCVPNKQKQLYKPSWMFFNDNPDVAKKFHNIIKGNVIDRIDRVWTAMATAGVKPISDAIHKIMDVKVNPVKDESLHARISARRALIKSICEIGADSIQSQRTDSFLERVEFARVDYLAVKWQLHAFDKVWPNTPSEPAYAHLDVGSQVIYFVQQEDGRPQWDSIAREVTQAIAPPELSASIAPGILLALEVDSDSEAKRKLIALGIPLVQELEREQVDGNVAHSLDDTDEYQRYNNWVPTENDERNGVEHGSLSSSGRTVVPEIPFAERLYKEQTTAPSQANYHPVSLPSGGPLTTESARIHTERSSLEGRSGTRVPYTATRWQPTEAAEKLAGDFRDMVQSDYGKRCQICSRSFSIRDNRLQVYVVHIVPPGKDDRTNHFGDLLGLCGWHYALLQYGQWAFLDSETKQEFKKWEHMRNFISGMSQDVDELGNPYVGILIRFYNVYDGWDAEPRTMDEEVRYSIPHWTYLCELIKD